MLDFQNTNGSPEFNARCYVWDIEDLIFAVNLQRLNEDALLKVKATAIFEKRCKNEHREYCFNLCGCINILIHTATLQLHCDNARTSTNFG